MDEKETVSIRLPKSWLAMIKKSGDKTQTDRSEWVRDAIRVKLGIR